MKRNEVYRLIIYCLNCIRRDQNSTYKTGLTMRTHLVDKLWDFYMCSQLVTGSSLLWRWDKVEVLEFKHVQIKTLLNQSKENKKSTKIVSQRFLLPFVTLLFYFIFLFFYTFFMSYQKIREKSFLQLRKFYIFRACFSKYNVWKDEEIHLCTTTMHVNVFWFAKIPCFLVYNH
jgi:hypothetical protein